MYNQISIFDLMRPIWEKTISQLSSVVSQLLTEILKTALKAKIIKSMQNRIEKYQAELKIFSGFLADANIETTKVKKCKLI